MEQTDNIRYYIFEWYDNRDAKSGNPVLRHTKITLPNFTREVGKDAKRALQIFMTENGNLKRITIKRIKEFNEHGQIGEDITMQAESTIVPFKK